MRHGSLLKIASIRFFFECDDFRRLSQIIANQNLENLAEREAEITNLPWTQTEKDILQLDAEVDNVPDVTKKPVLSLSAVTDEEGHPLKNEDESGRRLCEYWGGHFPSTCGRSETSPI